MNPFEGLLCYEDEVAISWQPITTDPSEIELTHSNESNENLLKATGSFGDHIAESDEFAELIPEFVRLDQKLNLIIEFLGVLLASHITIPEKRPVNMSPKGISIGLQASEQCPLAGTMVCIRLYIQPEIPKPLKIYGSVVDNLPGTADASFTICYDGISKVVESWLEKFIFRHHRRSVAQQRNS